MTKQASILLGLSRQAAYGMIVLVCAGLGWLVVAGSWLHPILAWPLVLLAPLLAAGATLYVITRFVSIVYRLPQRDAFEFCGMSIFGPSFLLNLNRDYPFLLVQAGQVAKKERNSTLYKVGGPGVLVVFNDSAVVLERNGRLTQVVGPSVVFLQRFEQVRDIIDLRPHVRRVAARVVTRDGITLLVDVQATFQFRMDPNQPPTDEVPYVPLPDDVRRAALLQTNFNRQRLMSWADRINGNLDSTLRGIVSDYTYDELFGASPDDISLALREKILHRLRADLEGMARNFCACLIDVQLGTFQVAGQDEQGEELDQQVQQQRIDNWRAVREGVAEFERAKGEAVAVELHQQAETEVRRQMIKNIVDCWQPLLEAGATPNWLVALRLVETLDQMHASPESGVFIPRETLDTLTALRLTLTPPPEDQ